MHLLKEGWGGLQVRGGLSCVSGEKDERQRCMDT